MVLSQNERIRAVVKWYSGVSHLTQKKIGEGLGYPNEFIFSQILNGHKGIPKALPGKIAALDERINPLFLIGESDEMLKQGNEQPNPDSLIKKALEPKPRMDQPGVFLPSEMVQMFTDLSATVRSQQETISLLVKAAVGEAAPKKDAM